MSGFAKSVSVGVIGHGRQEANAPGARGRFCARRCRPAGQPADPERGATRIRRAMPKVATEGGGKENPTLYISRQWHREERLALSSLRRRGAAVQGRRASSVFFKIKTICQNKLSDATFLFIGSERCKVNPRELASSTGLTLQIAQIL